MGKWIRGNILMNVSVLLIIIIHLKKWNSLDFGPSAIVVTDCSVWSSALLLDYMAHQPRVWGLLAELIKFIQLYLKHVYLLWDYEWLKLRGFWSEICLVWGWSLSIYWITAGISLSINLRQEASSTGCSCWLSAQCTVVCARLFVCLFGGLSWRASAEDSSISACSRLGCQHESLLLLSGKRNSSVCLTCLVLTARPAAHTIQLEQRRKERTRERERGGKGGAGERESGVKEWGERKTKHRTDSCASIVFGSTLLLWFACLLWQTKTTQPQYCIPLSITVSVRPVPA